MSISEIKPGERVKDVHFTEDTLSVDMVDGRTITVPLAWYPGFFTPHHSNEKIGRSVVVALGSTGQMLMRTSVLKDC